jgi:hypothetical protein
MSLLFVQFCRSDHFVGTLTIQLLKMVSLPQDPPNDQGFDAPAPPSSPSVVAAQHLGSDASWL